ncbi:MAG: ATP-binding protein [Candidatus Paceibacterota bacterium]|jgi:predicted HTH transcriptional regulator
MTDSSETDILENFLEGAVETPQIDFKASCPWESGSFAKDFLAMSNTIDGGRIIIGVTEEEDGSFVREGITSEDKRTFKIDTMKDQLAKYADPFVEFSISFPKDSRGLEYCVIRIEPFKEVPVICKIPDTTRGLYAGGIYYRNRNKRVESALVSNSYDMRDIIERAMLKMRHKAKLIGYIMPTATDDEIFMKALESRLKIERGEL